MKQGRRDRSGSECVEDIFYIFCFCAAAATRVLNNIASHCIELNGSEMKIHSSKREPKKIDSSGLNVR